MTVIVFGFLKIQTEMEMMRERFSKLLLGEDMSGSGKGVCTAMAISNAITNLCGMFILPCEFLMQCNPFLLHLAQLLQIAFYFCIYFYFN